MVEDSNVKTLLNQCNKIDSWKMIEHGGAIYEGHLFRQNVKLIEV